MPDNDNTPADGIDLTEFFAVVTPTSPLPDRDPPEGSAWLYMGGGVFIDGKTLEGVNDPRGLAKCVAVSAAGQATRRGETVARACPACFKPYHGDEPRTYTDHPIEFCDGTVTTGEVTP